MAGERVVVLQMGQSLFESGPSDDDGKCVARGNLVCSRRFARQCLGIGAFVIAGQGRALGWVRKRPRATFKSP